MKKISKISLGFVLGLLVSLTINVTAETLIDSGAVSYSNSNTNETTVSGALDELFSSIEISKQIGDMTKISAIGDGTIAGAISTLNMKQQTMQHNAIPCTLVSEGLAGTYTTLTFWVPKWFRGNMTVSMVDDTNTARPVVFTGTRTSYTNYDTYEAYVTIGDVRSYFTVGKSYIGYFSN